MEVDDVGLFGNDEPRLLQSEDEGGDEDDEAAEANGPAETAKPLKPKRVIKNPQPKLDAIRLMGPRGIGILESTFKDVISQGKGQEKEDLNILMKKLEHWAHRLFPKLPFDDTLKQIEKLGTKKPVQVTLKRLRLDMFESHEIIENDGDVQEDEAPQNEATVVDVFDELLGTRDLVHGSTLSRDLVPDSPPPPSISHNSPPADLTLSSSKEKKALTAEQQERMERSRRIAEEKRKARFLERLEREHKEKTAQKEKSISNTPNEEFDDGLMDNVVISEATGKTLCSTNEQTISRSDSSDVSLDLTASILAEASTSDVAVPEEASTVYDKSQQVASLVDRNNKKKDNSKHNEEAICAEDEILQIMDEDF